MNKETLLHSPLISIITVVYNGESEIQSTIDSIKQQTNKNFEYIVIDGSSTDSTVEIVRNSQVATKIISEPDKGLYDAMNKGLEYASGKYVLFLNAGDSLESYTTIEKVESFLSNSDADFIYGSVYQVVQNNRLLRQPRELSEIWKGMPFSHQAVFIRRSYHLLNKYDLSFKIGADYKFLYTSYLNKRQFFKINLVICNMTPGGISDTRRIECVNEHWKVIKKYSFSLKYYFFYKYLIFDQVLRKMVKSILPKFVVNKIILLKS